MPTARNIPRAAAFSRPSVTSRLRGLMSTAADGSLVWAISQVCACCDVGPNPFRIPLWGMRYAGDAPTIGDHWGAVTVNRSGTDNGVNAGIVTKIHNRAMASSRRCTPRSIPRSWGGQMAPAHGYSSQKDNYAKRLRRIEGQVRGIAKMIEDDKYCIDVLTQISAANNALRSVALNLLDEHLGPCVTRAVAEGGTEADEKLAEASAAIARLVRS